MSVRPKVHPKRIARSLAVAALVLAATAAPAAAGKSVSQPIDVTIENLNAGIAPDNPFTPSYTFTELRSWLHDGSSSDQFLVTSGTRTFRLLLPQLGATHPLAESTCGGGGGTPIQAFGANDAWLKLAAGSSTPAKVFIRCLRPDGRLVVASIPLDARCAHLTHNGGGLAAGGSWTLSASATCQASVHVEDTTASGRTSRQQLGSHAIPMQVTGIRP